MKLVLAWLRKDLIASVMCAHATLPRSCSLVRLSAFTVVFSFLFSISFYTWFYVLLTDVSNALTPTLIFTGSHLVRAYKLDNAVTKGIATNIMVVATL